MGYNLFWVAGCLSYSSSVFLAAYGYHSSTLKKENRRQWEKALRYQLFGSLPLLLSRFVPGATLACAFSSLGTILFCCPLYYTSATDDIRFNKAMPLGGTLIAVGWALLAFA